MKVNHTYLKLFLLALLVNWQFSYCQTEAPSSPAASAITQYSDYPVNYFTGMPNISVPLYTLPTRDTNMSIPLVVNYHAGSLAGDFENSGNCGRGWSLNPGAVVSRKINGSPDEIGYKYNNGIQGSDVYEFSVMGVSGKFRTFRDGTGSNAVYAKILENMGPQFKVLVFSDTNYSITEIRITDNRGYRYYFTAKDTYIHVSNHGRSTIPVSFHLTKLYDMNNRLLASYAYNDYSKVEPYHNTGESNKVKVLKTIFSEGFGGVDLAYSGTADYFRYNNIIVKDIYGQSVRRFDFNYSSSITPYNLIKIDEGPDVYNSPEKRSYKFKYKSMFITNEFTIVEDKWKYNRLLLDGCSNAGEADIYSTMGVLEKMTLPTGGSIVYEFEPNTYSWKNDKPLDLVTNKDTHQQYIANDFFTRLATVSNESTTGAGIENWKRNLHNYNINYIGSSAFSSPGSFNFSAAGTVYIRLTGESYTTSSGFLSYPEFQLKLQGSSTPIYTFKQLVSSYNVNENFMCLGKKFSLSNNNYSLTMTAPGSSIVYGTYDIFSMTPLSASQVKKWWYGGGVRIKSISYYDADVSVPYPSVANRKVSYEYNFFNEPNRSSGVLFRESASGSDVFTSISPTLGYDNVTVIDTKTGGRTEYDYHTSLDSENYIIDLEIGKLHQRRVYDNGGNLLQETDFTYDQETDWVDQGVSVSVTGWIDVTQVKNYYYNSANSGSPLNVVMTTDNYEYDENKQLSKHTQSSGVAGESLETRYTYNEAFYDIYVPDTIKTYRNGELISKSRRTYYTIPLGNPNVFDPGASPGIQLYTSFQLKDTQVAKADNNLETVSTITIYDDYNHVLEAKKENGLVTSFIWGYNNTQIIAKIEGVEYNAINSSLINAAQNASNVDPNTDPLAENNLLTALANLRNSSILANAYVTTYTYKSPLIGISTVTDTRGRKLSYEYDINNRLLNVKDQEGNILSETEYHIIP